MAAAHYGRANSYEPIHEILGPIVRVYVEESTPQQGFLAEEGEAITLKFASGTVGTFLLSDAAVSPHNFQGGAEENPMIPKTGQDFYGNFGSEGSLSVLDLTRWTYGGEKKSCTKSLSHEVVGGPRGKGSMDLQMAHFMKVVRRMEEPSYPGVESLGSVVVCDAIKRSMRD